MFTRNPVTGDDERVIEASWGLGEAVVAGIVIPDHYRINRLGQVLERSPGFKKIAVRMLPHGGTVEENVPTELVERLCLDDDQLQQLSELADRCDHIYGPARDIEWAIAGAVLYLVQCRAITKMHSTLKADDYFGEIAMIDEGTRMATITPPVSSSATASPTGTPARSWNRTA